MRENEIIVFDKMKWHTENNMPFEDAKKHFNIIMDFLLRNELLSEEGIEIYEQDGITEQFSIYSEMLNPKGVEFMHKFYDAWLKSYEKDDKINHPELLQQFLETLKKPGYGKGKNHYHIEFIIKYNKFSNDYEDASWLFSKKLRYIVGTYLTAFGSVAKVLIDRVKSYLNMPPASTMNVELRSRVITT